MCPSISRRMSYSSPTIMVVGGTSRIGAALVPYIGASARWVSRRKTDRVQEVCVTDYADISPDMFDGIECVVNCVGASKGRDLDRINVALPVKVATLAKSAGVRRFIHISSFSVYGGAQWIDRSTRPLPLSDYGRSKLAGDTALAAMMDAAFGVTLLRLPLIYGTDSLGKLGQLLKLWRRAGRMLVPVDDISRSMIGVELSAAIIAKLIEEPRWGVVFAADPRPFNYADTIRARPDDNLRLLPLAPWAVSLVARVAPSVGTRLFADSRLSDDANLAIEYGLKSRLYDDIAVADLVGTS